MAQIELAELATRKADIRDRLLNLLGNATSAEVNGQAAKIPDLGHNGSTVSVAFVGPYNAGKSTLLRLLTENPAFESSADVTTNALRRESWFGLDLIDTPGVRAGLHEHDEITESALRSADLIVFCMTVELWDDVICDYFRHVAVDLGRAADLVVIINKTDTMDADREIQRAEVDTVLADLAPDAPVVFASARMYEDSEEERDPKLSDLFVRSSNFEALRSTLDRFSSERGLIARTMRPVHEMRTIITESLALLQPDPEVQYQLALCGRMDREIDSFRRQADRAVDAVSAGTRRAILEVGDGVLDLFDAGTLTEADLEEADAEIERLVEEAAMAIDDRLQEAWNNAGDKIKEIAEKAEIAAQGNRVRGPGRASPKASTTAGLPFAPELLRDIARILSGFSDEWLAQVRPGGSVHGLIRDAGHLFNVKFKPWGVVNKGRAVGNGAAKAAAGLQALAILADTAQSVMDEVARRKTEGARTDLQAGYRRIATDASTELSRHFRPAIERIANLARGRNAQARAELEQSVSERGSTMQGLRQLRDEIDDLVVTVAHPVADLADS